MNIRLDIYPEQRLVVGRLFGPIDYEDVIAWLDAAMADPAFSRDYDGIVDFRGVTLKSARPDKARLIASYVIDEGFTTGKWAILADRPKETALAYIFSSIAGENYPIRIFSTIEAASAYLALDLAGILPAS